MPVAFEELEGSPRMRHTLEGFVAERELRVAWSDWPDMIRELWGSYRMVGGEMVFTPPAHFPGVPQALVSDVRIEPFDPANPTGPATLAISSGANSYAAGARVTVQYRTMFDIAPARSDLPEVPPGTFLLFQADLAGEMEGAPARHFVWDVAGTPAVEEQPALNFFLPSDEIRLSWQRVPRPPWGAMIERRGKLNSSTFLGYPPETVMFMGVRTRRDFQLLDTGLWRLDYYFKARAVPSTADGTTRYGWNHRWRGEATAGEHWTKVLRPAGDEGMYAQTDFGGLFAFG